MTKLEAAVLDLKSICPIINAKFESRRVGHLGFTLTQQHFLGEEL